MGNIALNKPVTANNSILPYLPSRAVDGNQSPSNRWVSDQLPAWLLVDPGAPYLVNRWVVKHPPMAGWQASNYANSDYKLQGSNNNANWVDLDIVTNNSANSTDRTFSPVAYRYFRVSVSKGLRCNVQTTSIMEFELYQAYSAQLTNLTISAGTLTPAFNPATLNYTATVNPDAASITVTPSAFSPGAVIKVNNVTAGSGIAVPVALSFGSNVITVNVTDGAVVQNYILTVTRPGSCLSSLTAQTTSGVNIPLNPTFVSGTQAYTASVANDFQKVTFTPTAQKTTDVITIKGETVASGVVSKPFDVAVGANQIPIVVTADGVGFQYTITINRASDANLLLDKVIVNYSGRTIQPGSVTVSMNATDTTYNAPVPSGAGSATVTPFAFDGTVVIKVNNVVVGSGNPSGAITLTPTGATVVTILVTSADGTSSRSYTLNITK